MTDQIILLIALVLFSGFFSSAETALFSISKIKARHLAKAKGKTNKLIKKIQKALDRIENETFGICDVCGEDISMKRLKARPVTTQCIDCKTKEEAKERALGL